MTEDFAATKFGGDDYDPERDKMRLTGALDRVFRVMRVLPDRWFTIKDLARLSDVPESSVGSYLCYLRRDHGYEVPK